MHHYHVIEFPNPKYSANLAFQTTCLDGTVARADEIKCGKYIHSEGYTIMFTLTVNDTDWAYPYPNSIQGNEIWYVDGSVENQVFAEKILQMLSRPAFSADSPSIQHNLPKIPKTK